MSNSKLVSYTKLSPNHSGKRTHKIDTITIHCMAGNLSVESCGAMFAKSANMASSNYGIGSDGRIALYVDEENRSWCSSNRANDQRAVTIEVANCGGAPDWPVSEKAYAALIELVVDICRRNGIKELLWKGDKSLIGQVDKQNMTVHRWFAAKACPGNYLYNRHGEIAEEVNRKLKVKNSQKLPEHPVEPARNHSTGFKKTYTVTASALHIRRGPSTTSQSMGLLKKGAKVTCYGYYSKAGDTIWLLVKAENGLTGHCSKKYLEEV